MTGGGTARRVLARTDRDALLIAVVGVVVFALLLGVKGLFHQDSWLALVAGREIWNNGIPHHDALAAMTMGRDWVDQQWLSQLAIYGLFRLGGLSLVSVVHVAFVGGSLAGAIAIGRRRGIGSRTMLIVVVVGVLLVLLPSFVVRTQPYAYPLFITTVYLLSRDSRSPSRRVYWVLPVLILWGNVHGSAVLGAGLVALRGVTIAVDRLRHREPKGWLHPAVLLVGAPLSLLVTPYGFGMVGYYRATLFNPDFNRLVAEWRPVSDVPIAAVPFYLLAGVAVWSLGRRAVRTTLWERAALIALLVGGIVAVRNVVWAELALLMLPAFDLDGGAKGATTLRVINRALVLTASAAVLVVLIIALSRSDADFQRAYPPEVLSAVGRATAADPGITVFTDVSYADWLLWRRPQLRGRIAFDARFELLTGGRLDRIARALTATGIDWRRAARGFRLVVLTPDEVEEAARGFRAEPGRRILFDDADGLVITRAARAAG